MKTHFAVCVDNSEYPASLEVHKDYGVIPDQDAEQDGDLSVTDESGEDYLYPEKYFLAIELSQEIDRVLAKSFDGR